MAAIGLIGVILSIASLVAYFAVQAPHLRSAIGKRKLGHQQMYDLERFYGTKVGFYKGTDSYKSYKLVQTPNFSVRLMPYS